MGQAQSRPHRLRDALYRHRYRGEQRLRPGAYIPGGQVMSARKAAKNASKAPVQSAAKKVAKKVTRKAAAKAAPSAGADVLAPARSAHPAVTICQASGSALLS